MNYVYRAWHKKLNRMYFVYSINVLNRFCLCGSNIENKEDFHNTAIREFSIKIKRFRIEDLYIMKPLDMEDMDNTPIYELDRLQLDDEVGIVQYRSPQFVLAGEDIKRQVILHHGLKCRIVGNVFENGARSKNLAYIPKEQKGDFLREQEALKKRWGLPASE